MSNGYTTEQMLDRLEHRLEDHLLRLEGKIDDVMSNGCAHRKDDLERIDKMEGRTEKLEDRIWTDRGISGAIAAGVAAVAAWIKGG